MRDLTSPEAPGFGLRSDMATAWLHMPVQAKTILPILLSITAIWLAMRSSRPAARLALWLLIVPVALAFAMVLDRIAVAEGPLWSETVGQAALSCLGSITVLSALPLVAGVFLFRSAAPTRPVLTGALMGVAIAAGVAAGYALHCTEDSPLFFSLGMALSLASLACLGLGWETGSCAGDNALHQLNGARVSPMFATKRHLPQLWSAASRPECFALLPARAMARSKSVLQARLVTPKSV